MSEAIEAAKIKIVELRKLINTTLRTVHPRVYYQRAPETATYPYLVYDLPDSIDSSPVEQFNLEVDGWDKPSSGDTTALETLMDSVDQTLNGRYGVVSDSGVYAFLSPTQVTGVTRILFGFACYRTRRLSLTDDDPLIHRRKYTYDLRVIGG